MIPKKLFLSMSLIMLMAYPALAGPYDEEGIAGDDPAIVGWADDYMDYYPAQDVDDGWKKPEKALGPAAGSHVDVVSLGECPDAECEPGRIILLFEPPIIDGQGPDLAVFENSFKQPGDKIFGELAYVEVSTDGETFARFNCRSLVTGPIAKYGPIDPTDVYNLAGKHLNGYGVSFGTPFDLAELASDPLVESGEVDLSAIEYVRLIDIPGYGEYEDSEGSLIYDPWPTTESAGFDLEAVAVLNSTITGNDDDNDDDDDDDHGDDDDNDDDDSKESSSATANDEAAGCGD